MGAPIRFTFLVISNYDARELEELVETLENRGAIVRHIAYGFHEVYVPAGLEWIPFLKTMDDCKRSIHKITIEDSPSTESSEIEEE